MQSLDVISINLWNILISLCNLLILFAILKKLLYQPVNRVLQERAQALQEQYNAAAVAQQNAENNEKAWQKKMQTAEEEADRLLKKADERSKQHCEQLLTEAGQKANAMIEDAREQAVAEHLKAQAEIKQEVIELSATLTETLLKRSFNMDDHRAAIESAIAEIGEKHE